MKRYKSRVIWLRGCLFIFFFFLPMRSLRQSAIRNIRYACVAAGYFTGLETSIISQQPFDFKHVPVKPPSGDAVQCRNATVAGPFNQKILQSDVLPFFPPLHPNFTFHLDISLYACDSCSPPPVPLPELRPAHPFIRHSAVLRRAGRSRADCTRGLREVTAPCCLLASCLLDDATVHLQGKWILAYGKLSFLWIAACFSCRHFVKNLNL